MSITTKTGDRGWTKTLFGRRLRKDDRRVEAYGTIDELNSFLGLAKSSIRSARVRKLIERCQFDLFILASEIAVLPRDAAKLEHRTTGETLAWIEGEIEALEAKLDFEGCCFFIPGESRSGALLDVARCVARRAERLGVALHGEGKLAERMPLVYLNRLSDLLYLLARGEEKRHKPFVAGRGRRGTRGPSKRDGRM
ncbi:MAG: cob(I)yrinic acid a,c-diamide adenosyltransferase [Planctomycetota bacterium]